MSEVYMHSDYNLIYIEESIPGPLENSAEYDEMLANFNSQLTDQCNCDSICTIESCNCLMRVGDANYEQLNKTSRLQQNFLDNIGNLSYPIIECNSLCKCSEYCGNRVVQRGPIQGLVVKDCTNICKGKGLFTTQFIPSRTFICEYAGEIITLNQAETRHKLNLEHGKKNYIFCLNEFFNETWLQTIVDPSMFGNLGRYINHSCEPNCVIKPVRIESHLPKLAIFSQVDIPSNCEITFNYGTNSFSNPEEVENGKTCLCGSNTCKGLMPFEKY